MEAFNRKNAEVHVCSHCGRLLPKTSYFKSLSALYAGIGHIPTCKKCMSDEYKQYRYAYRDPQRAMQRICMLYDLYFSSELFEKTYTDDDDSIVSKYVRATNLNQQKGKTFDASINEGFFFTDRNSTLTVEKVVAASVEVVVKPELVTKWGGGLANMDYSLLEEHYKHLKSSNPNCDSNQEIFILDLCYTKMLQMKALRESRVDDFNKLTESYRKSFAQAGLKTIQDTSANSEDCWGQWMERIAQYTPEEYYKNKKLYKDFDGIGDYMERFVLRPLRNLQFGSRDRDSEFKVVDEEDYRDAYSESE